MPPLSPPLLIELSWTDEQGGLAEEEEEEEEVVSPPPEPSCRRREAAFLCSGGQKYIGWKRAVCLPGFLGRN